MNGLQVAEVQVDLVPTRLQAHGLDVRQVAQSLRQSNVNLSGGYIEEGSRRLLVRSVGEFHTLDEIRNQPLGSSGLRVRDVAEVSYSFPRQERFNFLNGARR